MESALLPHAAEFPVLIVTLIIEQSRVRFIFNRIFLGTADSRGILKIFTPHDYLILHCCSHVIGRFCKTLNVNTMCIAWKGRESLETVISPAAIRNLNTFPSLVKSKVLLLAMMLANGQSKRARNSHFLRRHQAGHWRGVGIRNLPPPSPSPSFQPCFTIWCLKSRYGYITRSNMIKYEV